MSVCVLRASALVAALALAGPVAAQQAHTTRIEPRPVYGATVTIEEGVRVFRPLPPERHVIVNPGGATPIQLSINETPRDRAPLVRIAKFSYPPPLRLSLPPLPAGRWRQLLTAPLAHRTPPAGTGLRCGANMS